MRTCSKCKSNLSLENFCKDKRIKDGIGNECKSCKRKRAREYYRDNRDSHYRSQKKWKERNPEKYSITVHKIWLKRRYGITLEKYEEMYRNQKGVCAICQEVNTAGKRLCVDHDHKTGKVRDLLCRKCNSILGYIKESKETAKNIFSYLEKHENHCLL